MGTQIFGYSSFAEEMRRGKRHILSENSLNYLEELRSYIEKNKVEFIGDEFKFYRAQIGCANGTDVRDFINASVFGTGAGPAPHRPQRMVPRSEHARDGRLNCHGAPVLYVADDAITAAMETRPFLTDVITVSEMISLKRLKIADLLVDLEKSPVRGVDFQTGELQEFLAWFELAADCCSPVRPNEERSQYTPTQVIAEFLSESGFSGIRYGSAMRPGGINYAIFSTEDLKIVNSVVCRSIFKDIELTEIPSGDESISMITDMLSQD